MVVKLCLEFTAECLVFALSYRTRSPYRQRQQTQRETISRSFIRPFLLYTFVDLPLLVMAYISSTLWQWNSSCPRPALIQAEMA